MKCLSLREKNLFTELKFKHLTYAKTDIYYVFYCQKIKIPAKNNKAGDKTSNSAYQIRVISEEVLIQKKLTPGCKFRQYSNPL